MARAFVEFIIIAIFSWSMILVGYLVGGFVASLVAGETSGRGALSRFLAGIFG